MNEFVKLNSVNVNEHTEEKNGLTYLSWAWAWAEFKKVYPEATYEVKRYALDRPYVYDPDLGYMVSTSVTVDDLTHEMWLPVMDGRNKAMKGQPYKYTVGQRVYEVKAADMMDINKTIMRCLVKNLAMFGLGLYIYAGEDLPEQIEEEKVEDKRPCTVEQIAELGALLPPERIEKMKECYKVTRVQDMTYIQVEEILQKLRTK